MANISPKGRVSFPNVFRPHAFEDGGTPKFDVTLIFDKDDMTEQQLELLKKMVAEANKAAVEKFGVKIGEDYKGKPINTPFRKTDEKPDYYEPGKIFVKFTTRQAPGVVFGDRSPIDANSRDFYAGCWAHASYTVFGYDKSGNRGVAFGLQNIQKTADDEPFSGGASAAEDDFEDLGGGAVTNALSTPDEDEIPF